jgi:exodeoxyribonuclease VII small subunit
MSQKPVAKMTFEEAMKELEAVVAQLESGDVELEKSIALYQRGAELKAHCDARLAEAQERVEKIRLGEGGTPTGIQPFEAS